MIPIDPQVNKVWSSSRPNLSVQQYHISKNWQLLTHRYFLLLGTKNVFCQRCLDLFLVEDMQVLSNVSFHQMTRVYYYM